MTSTLKTEKLQFRGDNSDAITLSSSGGVTVDNAHVTMGTAGKGIDFSVNAGSSKTGASTTSEILTHYEEGTWVPTILGSSSHPSITTSVAAGKYIRIGNLVHIQWNMIITNVASQGTGNAQVGGLPYPAVCNTYQGHIGIMYNDVWSVEVQKGYVPNGGDYIQLAPTGRTQSNFGYSATLGTGYFGGGGSYVVG